MFAFAISSHDEFLLYDVDRTSALYAPIRFPIFHPLWNVSHNSQEGRRVADFGRFRAQNCLLWQRALTDRENYQVEQLHQHVYKLENLVTIGLVV